MVIKTMRKHISTEHQLISWQRVDVAPDCSCPALPPHCPVLFHGACRTSPWNAGTVMALAGPKVLHQQINFTSTGINLIFQVFLLKSLTPGLYTLCPSYIKMPCAGSFTMCPFAPLSPHSWGSSSNIPFTRGFLCCHGHHSVSPFSGSLWHLKVEL